MNPLRLKNVAYANITKTLYYGSKLKEQTVVTIVLLNRDLSFFENNVDPDQISDEAIFFRKKTSYFKDHLPTSS